MLSLWLKTYKGLIGNWHIFLVLLRVSPRLYIKYTAGAKPPCYASPYLTHTTDAVATTRQLVSAQGKARCPGLEPASLPLVETDCVASCVA